MFQVNKNLDCVKFTFNVGTSPPVSPSGRESSQRLRSSIAGASLPYITSLTISNHLYHVLHIDQTSQTLRLSRSELQGSFCNATFTATTLPPQIFELSSTFKNLTVFYLCDPNLSYRSSYTCPPGKGPITVSENHDYRKSCHDSFMINVPKSFVPEGRELNLTHIESALREGFEVKLKIDKKACQDCSSHEIFGFNNTTQVYCKEASSSACNTLYSLIHGTRHVLEVLQQRVHSFFFSKKHKKKGPFSFGRLTVMGKKLGVITRTRQNFF